MKKLLLFVVVSLFSTFITNGQKLTVMNDLESDNTDLDTEFRHSFDGGILFSFRKKFEIEDTYCTSDGTIENTKETTENPGVNYNSDLKGNYDVGDGYIYYKQRINTGSKIYRLSKQTLDLELFTIIDLPSNTSINDIDYYNGYFYYTVKSSLYRISLVNKEIELVSKLGFYEAKGVKVFKDKIYLLADNDDGNYGLFDCTGTAASIKLIKKLKPFNGISDQTIHWFEFKDKLYFSLYFTTDEPGSIYFTDGTENGTGKLVDLHYNSFSDFYNLFKIGNVGDRFIFFEHVPDGGIVSVRLYGSDGTPQGTGELLPGTVLKFLSYNFEVVNNECYFISENTLYKTDGTKSGTVQAHSENIKEFNFLEETLYYVADDFSVYREDKDGNSSQVKYNGSSFTTYEKLFKSGNKLYFTSSISGDRRLIALEETSTNATVEPITNRILISPNLISNQLTLDESLVGYDIIVYDNFGNQKLQQPISQAYLDCSALPSGIYFAIFLDKKNNKIFKSNFTKM